MRALSVLVLVLFVSACNAANGLPSGLQTTPQGAASRTGVTPLLLPDPKGQTAQFTEAEKAALKRDLNASAAEGRQAAGRVDAAQARRDVASLRAEALAERKRRLLQIEDREIDIAERTIDAD